MVAADAIATGTTMAIIMETMVIMNGAEEKLERLTGRALEMDAESVGGDLRNLAITLMMISVVIMIIIMIIIMTITTRIISTIIITITLIIATNAINI
ncbi:hypothetical protein LXJ15735_25960 [Lacrimispora xylanolytica]|uniref:Uncharacterized protein n=1 Tax=Lacrimispora xylanolytica TaxID=29375 RepID=A0ABY7A6M2_9FIRM|nr:MULTISPECIES: hypothetical protein [Lacrimispora]MBS5957962.1 hypothetical protein [Clostridiales bacterium]WAJ22310.1 hypothetical protein OW255_12050 [Lacrimispora xylanolytica]